MKHILSSAIKDDIEEMKVLTGTDLSERVASTRHMCHVSDDGTYTVAFYYCDPADPLKKDEQIIINCTKNDFTVLCPASCEQAADDVNEDLGPHDMMLGFLFGLVENDFGLLEHMESEITTLEDSVAESERIDPLTSDAIVMIRRKLLKIKRYYEQLAIITTDLAENEYDVFTPELQKKFGVLDRRIDKLLESVYHLREYITQVREAYQAQVDIEQNQIMKTFTVVTSVFLPLTLIVGWYGMNLKMPEFGWSFGYPMVIILSVFVLLLCVGLFKRKKWF
jgi:magnesium transporter